MTHAVMAFGRMNPPTTGHEKLIKRVHSHAKKVGGSAHVIASHSEGSSDNPIPQKHKIGYIKKIAPSGVNVSGSSKSQPTILHHAARLHAEGHEHLTVVAGSDRRHHFKKLLNRYNGKKGAHGHYNFKSINVVSSGRRDPDSHGTSGVSGTSMRDHARTGNHASFKKGLPKALHPHQKEITDHINSVKEQIELEETVWTTPHHTDEHDEVHTQAGTPSGTFPDHVHKMLNHLKDKDNYHTAMKAGTTTKVSPLHARKLGNTDAGNPKGTRGLEGEKVRRVHGLGKTQTKPIALKDKHTGHMHLLAGNTRLTAAAARGDMTHVHTIHYDSSKMNEEKEMSAAGKKGMADFQKKQERTRLKKFGTSYEKSRRKTNTFGYGSYGPKQFAEANLPPHLAKFVDKKGDLKPEAAKRVQKARKKSTFKIIDRTPKGYGNEPANSTPAPWKDARVTKEEIELDEGEIAARADATNHMKRDGADHTNNTVQRKYMDHHMAKQGFSHRVGSVYLKGNKPSGFTAVDPVKIKMHSKLSKTEEHVPENIMPNLKPSPFKQRESKRKDPRDAPHMQSKQRKLRNRFVDAKLTRSYGKKVDYKRNVNEQHAKGGFDYEHKVNHNLQKHGLQKKGQASAGASADAPDGSIHANGKHHHLEIKKDHNAMMGQVGLHHHEGSWKVKPSAKKKYPATSKHIEKHLLPHVNKKIGKPSGDYHKDKKEHGNIYHHVKGTHAIKDHYGKDRKTPYIQIGGSGLHHTDKDHGKLGTKSLNGNTQYRMRVKYHGTNKKTGKVNYSHTVVLGLKDHKKSHVDLDHHSGDIGKKHAMNEARSPLQKLKDYDKVRVAVGKKPIFRSNEKKVKPVKEEIDPHIKIMIAKGDSDEKIKKMHPKVTDAELEKLREGSEKMSNEELELQEVLTLIQRMKRSRTMRKFSKKISRRKKILSKRIAPKKALAKRSRRAAVRLARKKYAGKKGQQYNKLSVGDKMMVDKRIATKKIIIGKIAKRLMPKVRKAELVRLRSKGKKKVVAVRGSKAREQFDHENQLWDFIEQFDNIKIKDLEAIEEKAIKSGEDIVTLIEVFDRGLEDWSPLSNHSPEQHAFNRLNSFLANGKARELDEDLDEAVPNPRRAFAKKTPSGLTTMDRPGAHGTPLGKSGGHTTTFAHGTPMGRGTSKPLGGSHGKPKTGLQRLRNEDHDDGVAPHVKKFLDTVTSKMDAGKEERKKKLEKQRRDDPGFNKWLKARGKKNPYEETELTIDQKFIGEELFLEFRGSVDGSFVADPVDPKKIDWSDKHALAAYKMGKKAERSSQGCPFGNKNDAEGQLATCWQMGKRGDSYLPFVKHKRMPEETEVDEATPLGHPKGYMDPKLLKVKLGAKKVTPGYMAGKGKTFFQNRKDLADKGIKSKPIDKDKFFGKKKQVKEQDNVRNIPKWKTKEPEKEPVKKAKSLGPSLKGLKPRNQFGRIKEDSEEPTHIVTYTKGSRVGARSHRMVYVNAKDEGHAEKVAKKHPDHPGKGYKVSHVHTYSENVDKAELKLQHAREKEAMKTTHKTEKRRLKRMKDEDV